MSRWILTVGAAVMVAIGGVAFSARTDQPLPAEGAGLSLVIDLASRQLLVKEGGSTVQTYPVAIGAPKHPTPRGTFNIRRIIWNPRWVPPDAKWARNRKPAAPGAADNPMGKVKIFFKEPDYYIHGTREVDSLGRAESHGCIRMRNSDVIELARRVMANGGAAKPDSWFQRVINRVRSTESVRLSNPVVVRIS